jgi:hypothetical protein
LWQPRNEVSLAISPPCSCSHLCTPAPGLYCLLAGAHVVGEADPTVEKRQMLLFA